MKDFTSALNKGIEFVNDNSSEEIAKVILPQFPDSSLNDLITIVERYKDADSWFENPYISEYAYNNLMDMLMDFKLTEKKVPYNDLVNNLYE